MMMAIWITGIRTLTTAQTEKNAARPASFFAMALPPAKAQPTPTMMENIIQAVTARTAGSARARA